MSYTSNIGGKLIVTAKGSIKTYAKEDIVLNSQKTINFTGKEKGTSYGEPKKIKPKTDLLITKVEGPFDDKDQLVEKPKTGIFYTYKATPSKKLNEAELILLRWAIKEDDGKLIDVLGATKYNQLASNGCIMINLKVNNNCEQARVYAYFQEPSEKVSVELEFKVVEDVVTYHIYSTGVIEKHIPKKIKKGFEKKYKYLYYDKNANKHELGMFSFKLTVEMDKGNIAGIKNVELIDIREFKGYSSNRVSLKFLTINSDSQRYYINPNCFAGLLGAMANLNIDYLGFNGFSNHEAKSTGGSKSHRNGEKGDLRYLSKNKRGEITLLQDSHFNVDIQNRFNDSLYSFGWGRLEKMYSEFFTYNLKRNYLLNHTKHMKKDGPKGYRHHHHLHLTGFDHSLIKIIK